MHQKENFIHSFEIEKCNACNSSTRSTTLPNSSDAVDICRLYDGKVWNTLSEFQLQSLSDACIDILEEK